MTVLNEYLLWILFFYIIVISLNYYKNNLFILCADRFFLILLSLMIFLSNETTIGDVFLNILLLIFLVTAVYIIAFFFYKKHGKPFILNFSKLGSFTELMLVVFVLLFGIQNYVVINVLFFAMCDIVYKIVILTITFHLKKKFSIQ